MIIDYINYPEKYVFPFIINEKNGKTRTIITYNKSEKKGLLLRREHQKDIDDFRRNFWDRNSNSFAYHKNVRCIDAIDSHLRSNFFIKLDIHHFFESITYDNFLKVYGKRFNTYWKETLRSFFYKDNLSIGFVSSPLISDFYMSEFDNAINEYLETNPFLHYSRYSDDMLLSSEEDNDESLNELYNIVLSELSKLNLEINDKKTRRIKLDYSKHNSISFLGLNISKANETDNKVTISKNYIMFLLYLIEKNNKYNNKCKELCDEINSRVAYLAYNSPLSFERFQKKYFYIYGKEYDFIPKKVMNRTQPIHATEIENYQEYLNDFDFDIHYKMVEQDTGSVKYPDAISLKKCKIIEKISKVEVPKCVNVIGKNAFSYTHIDEIVLPTSVKAIGVSAFTFSNVKKVVIPNSVGVISSYAFSYTRNLSSITLPHKLSKIKEGTFERCGIKKIEIPENVKTIEKYSFRNCEWLMEVKILGNIDTIPESCFEECKSLKKVLLPDSVISIEKNAFKRCLDLEEIVLPNSLVSLDASAFSECYSLKKLFIPKSVTDISNIYELKGIKKVEFEEGHPLYQLVNNLIIDCSNKLVLSLDSNVIPEGIELIGENAFYNSKIKNIVIPSSVHTIEEYAFKDCKFLKKVTLPDSIAEIKESAFSNCVSLKEMVLPKNLKVLNKKTFNGCFRLEKVVLPEGLKKISDLAFYGCRNLKHLSLPSSLVELGYGVFELCNSLKALEIGKELKKVKEYTFSSLAKSLEIIKVDQDNKTFTSMDSNIIVRIKDKDLILGCKNSKVPSGVVSIHKKAFEYCNGLINLDLPDTLERIGDNAFYQCTKLKYVKAGSIFELGNNAFSGCCELLEFVLPESLTKIGDECFSDCKSLKEAVFPSSISKIGNSCFKNCASLKKIFISQSINNISYSWFTGCNDIETIEVDVNNNMFTSGDNCNAIIEGDVFGNYVLLGCKNTHLTKTNKYGELSYISPYAFAGCNIQNIVIPEGVEVICAFAFKNCKKLETVTLPESLNAIELSAFDNCTSLKQIIIPNNVETIAGGAFKNCEKLEKVILSESLTEIHDSVFENCKSLESINIPDSVTTIDSKAFLNCEKISSIVIPEGVESISTEAFQGCKSLKEINIPKGIKDISSDLFNGCENLDDVLLPEGVETINGHAFYNCLKLSKIDLPESIKVIGKGAFENCKSLTKVKIPSMVKELDHVFYNCDNLEEVEYPDSLEDLDITSFINTKIKKLFIPKSVNIIRFDEDINGSQFDSIEVDEDNEGFTSLNSNIICKIEHSKETEEVYYSLLFGCNNSKIPEGVYKICPNAFAGCEKLSIDKWPDSLKEIEFDAFYNCKGLKKVVFSSNSKLEFIHTKAFYNCDIDELYIYNTVRIASDAFTRDDLSRRIKEIVIGGKPLINNDKYGINHELMFCAGEFSIPEGAEGVSRNAYLGMDFPETLVIPNSVVSMTQIPENNIIKHLVLYKFNNISIFDECNEIEDIKLSSNHRYYKVSSDGKAVMTKNGEELLFLGKGGKIPESVKCIRYGAINPLRNPDLFITSNIEELVIDNNFTSIKVDKNNPYFDDDNGNNCLVKTETKTLIHTSKMASPDDDILVIGDSAYNRSDITVIHIGKNVKNINIKGFIGCPSLSKIIVDKDNLYYYNNQEEDEIYSKKSDSLVYSLKKKKQDSLATVRVRSLWYEGEKKVKKTPLDGSSIDIQDPFDDPFSDESDVDGDLSF